MAHDVSKSLNLKESRMKKLVILLLMAAAILSGCANKPSTIDRTSPCACYDEVVKFA